MILRKENHEVKDSLKEIQKRVDSMRLLYEKLLLDDNYSEAPIKEYIEEIVKNIEDLYGEEKRIDIILNIEKIILSTQQLSNTGIIVNELITNCFKYAFIGKQNGRINLSIYREAEDYFVIKVKDDGVGISNPDYKGFGTTIVNMLAKQMHGEYNINVDGGTENIVRLAINL